jgi:hypothetical protein
MPLLPAPPDVLSGIEYLFAENRILRRPDKKSVAAFGRRAKETPEFGKWLTYSLPISYSLKDFRNAQPFKR